jgi:hypothetical protein
MIKQLENTMRIRVRVNARVLMFLDSVEGGETSFHHLTPSDTIRQARE